MVVYDIRDRLTAAENNLDKLKGVLSNSEINKKYRMQFSYDSEAVVVTMPHCQNDLEIQTSQANEVYNGLTMPLSMLGNAELRQINISTFLPARQYSWADPLSVANPKYYIDFFQSAMDKKVPLRLRLFCNNEIIINLPVCVNAMNFSIQKNSDYLLALNLQEYKLVTIRKSGGGK